MFQDRIIKLRFLSHWGAIPEVKLGVAQYFKRPVSRTEFGHDRQRGG